jgi:hypothetical protein
MSMNDLAEALRTRGYDIVSVPARPGHPADSELIARREFGDRVIEVTADAGGRFRLELTRRVGEWPSQIEAAGVSVRVIDGVTRTVSATGSAPDPGQMVVAVDELTTLLT